MLDGDMVLRTPTRAELAGRLPIVLTARDQEILGAVHAHGLLTTDLIRLAFFPERGTAGVTSAAFSSSCYQRLRQLWLWRYLDKIERPVARALGGSQPLLYALARDGEPFATTGDDDGAPVGRLRLDRLAGRALKHDLTTASLWAHLVDLFRSTPVCSWRWVAERELRAMQLRVKDPQTGRWLPFLPDGYLEVDYFEAAATNGVTDGNVDPDQSGLSTNRPRSEGATVQCCLVEVDMGTLSLPRFRRKVRAFELALGDGLFARRWGRREFEVLVLAPSDGRRDRLRQAARREVAPQRWGWYSFATVEVLDPTRIGGYEWLTLDGERVRLLYDQAPDA